MLLRKNIGPVHFDAKKKTLTKFGVAKILA
jgi:hypothetical protein